MNIAVKYLKDCPVFYAWNLDDSKQKIDYYDHIVSDVEDSDLYDEIGKYGKFEVIAEGIYRYTGNSNIHSLMDLVANAKEVVIIQNPTEEEKEEFMIDYD